MHLQNLLLTILTYLFVLSVFDSIEMVGSALTSESIKDLSRKEILDRLASQKAPSLPPGYNVAERMQNIMPIGKVLGSHDSMMRIQEWWSSGNIWAIGYGSYTSLTNMQIEGLPVRNVPMYIVCTAHFKYYSRLAVGRKLLRDDFNNVSIDIPGTNHVKVMDTLKSFMADKMHACNILLPEP
ncbi:hypothetical protein BDF22DRAFT_741431 [Syncephalis plumigaleata]|nr:hypothetical protein BDF22DRAFT_741431 [Syncephalis plumigaleata]